MRKQRSGGHRNRDEGMTQGGAGGNRKGHEKDGSTKHPKLLPSRLAGNPGKSSPGDLLPWQPMATRKIIASISDARNAIYSCAM